jgi:hypothetical protein
MFARSLARLDLGADSGSSVDASWATISTDILLAELRRRGEEEAEKPKCGGKNGGWYDTAAHVVALVLILVVSTLSKLHDIYVKPKCTILTLHRLRIPVTIETSPSEQQAKQNDPGPPSIRWHRRGACDLLLPPFTNRLRIAYRRLFARRNTRIPSSTRRHRSRFVDCRHRPRIIPYHQGRRPFAQSQPRVLGRGQR